MELKKDQTICNGNCFICKRVFTILRSKCNGDGKVDWIENITDKPAMTQSEIDNKTVDLLVFLYNHT